MCVVENIRDSLYLIAVSTVPQQLTYLKNSTVPLLPLCVTSLEELKLFNRYILPLPVYGAEGNSATLAYSFNMKVLTISTVSIMPTAALSSLYLHLI